MALIKLLYFLKSIPKYFFVVCTDQTPTPSSFLKTADVEGSPLFQELNPFDRVCDLKINFAYKLLLL